MNRRASVSATAATGPRPAATPGRPRADRRARDDRASALLLFPAAVFVLCVLAALAVDAAHATMRRRELQHAADAAANDAAALALDEASLRSGTTRLDPELARSIARSSIEQQRVPGVRTVTVRVDEDGTVVVELEAVHPAVFARALPGAAREIRVPARASARPVTAGEGR
jgi:Flp pilus assembly protein TadG